ncbi:MAG: pilus assembly protein TadG-related protein [Oscillospiraceae bacterium]|nr:pilus assembly protein TadG-related protein [Oscillospiraceae bacterium]
MKRRIGGFLRRFARAQRGSTLTIACIALAALLGMSALVVDMGAMYAEKSGLQNALDAAALAGAQCLPDYSDATQKAQRYFEANGYAAADLTVTFSAQDTITCTSSAQIQTTFARVLGVTSTTTSELHATALKTTRKMASPFDYGVFQGEPGELLQLGGAAFSINGGVFSNGAFECKPGGLTTITGVTTVDGGDPDIIGCVSIGTLVKGADPIGMVDMQPYFDGLLTDATSGHVFSTATADQIKQWGKAWQPFTISGYNKISGSFKTSALCIIDGVLIVNGDFTAGAGIQINSGGALIVYGNLSWGGYNGHLPSFNNSLIYVTGSLKASPGGTGTTFTGANNVYVKGDMTLAGSGIVTTGNTFFYCQNGSLTVTASCSSIYLCGTLYAYNGTVVLESRPNIYGAVIGRHIDSFPGGLTVTYPPDGLGYSATQDAYKLID